MSKRIQYPNGFVGFASDAAAAVLAQRPGHKILGDAKAESVAEKKVDPKAKAEK